MSLRIAFESGQPHSCILWGPPGVGKTTIARAIVGDLPATSVALIEHDMYYLDHSGLSEEARAQVNFGRHGPKWLALSVAKLTPV